MYTDDIKILETKFQDNKLALAKTSKAKCEPTDQT